MSLNVYARIKKYEDNDKTYSMSVEIQDLSDRQMVELKHLKSASVVRLVAESAEITFTDEVDYETRESRYQYRPNADGLWLREKNGQLSLDLDEQPEFERIERHITTNIVDDFIVGQHVAYPEDFNAQKALTLIAEGYEYDEVATQLGMATAEVVIELNKARVYFAPFAVAWLKREQELAAKRKKGEG